MPYRDFTLSVSGPAKFRQKEPGNTENKKDRQKNPLEYFTPPYAGLICFTFMNYVV